MEKPEINVRQARSGDIVMARWPKPSLMGKGIVQAQTDMGFPEKDRVWTHAMIMGVDTTVVSAVWHRVKVLDLYEDYLKKGAIAKVYRYKKWRVRNEISDRARFVQHAFSESNLPYDWLAYVGFIMRTWLGMNVTIHARSAVFCSETVFQALKRTKIIEANQIIGNYAEIISDHLGEFNGQSADRITPAHFSYAMRRNVEFEEVTEEILSANPPD